MDIFYLLLSLAAGLAIAIQAATNATLGKSTGLPSFAAFMSFATGIVPLFIYYLIESHQFQTGTYANSKWWHYLGGILGAFFVFTVIKSVPHLGASVVLAVTVAAQVFLSLILDHFGLLGLDVQKASILRIIGTVLIVSGAIMLAVKK